MIQLYGTITDPAGSPVPGAIIELRALSTTDEVLLGSVLTFKCDPAGSYRFPLAVGSYDVYAQNDLCGDMDYLGTGYVMAQSQDGSLNSILLDSGVEITPPMIERALNAMIKSESAARTTEQNRVITNQDRLVTEEASRMAVESAQAVQANASTVNTQAMAIEQASQVIALQAGSTETAKVAVEQMHREVIINASSIAKAVAATEINANSAEMAAQTAEGAKSVVVETAEQVDRLEGLMAAHSVMVQDRAVEVTTQVRNLASLASVVQLIASNVAHAQNVINEMSDQVAANAVLAQSAAKTATDNANMTTEHQLATSSSERHAKFAEMMAEAWAQNPEDIAINGRPGEFSALHWALQAQKWAQSITSQLVWAGPWNANKGAPEQPHTGQGIPFYRISHAGSIAGEDYAVGDYLHWVPASEVWFRIDGSDAVISVNGMTGTVVLSAADVGAKPASWQPSWSDVIDKPQVMPPSPHQHAWDQLTQIPVYARRWPAWGEITDQPDFASSEHRHKWSDLDDIPTTASRWPSYGEITNKPSFAPANHTHSYYFVDGGTYGTLYLKNWYRSNGDTGWLNRTHDGGIYMKDPIWIRTYGGKRFYVDNTDHEAITSAGGVEAVGHGNFSDLFIRSDERSQTNVTPITDALAKVKQLQGCLRDIRGQRQAGLVAQHIADVQPESVFINRDGLLSFSSSGVFALLVEALKELDDKLENAAGEVV
ncbi:prophage tail fiber N-terminal domain-containing protein [Aeromonas veronii]|uniref:prophage tail fiber N-terminal domain-containing protein n=1 Tax=Aeromonas veronii TaxID=654 RepID=UPI003BA21499